MPLTKTRALMADLAAALNLPGLPQDDNGGFELTIGDDTTVLIYGGDDETMLVVAPIGPLPAEPGYGLVVYLLRQNMFDSDITPFQIAIDSGGNVILWGRLGIEEFTGETLAALIAALAETVSDLKEQVVGDGEEEDGDEETETRAEAA